MIDVQYELEQLHENPEWLTVLETYDRLITSSKKANPESEGWMTRLREFDGVELEDLSHIHGSLIAHGFLRFQIADRTSGMEYRLSQLGKQALTRQFAVEQDEPADVSHGEQPNDTVMAEATTEVNIAADVVESADVEHGVVHAEVQSAAIEDAAHESVEERTVTLECPEPQELVQLAFDRTEQGVLVDQPQPKPLPTATTRSVLEFPLPIIDLDDLKKSA